MEFTEEQVKQAKHFGQFYIDLMENNSIRYYLSNEIVLDWFGQTVKGEKKVNMFLKSKMASVKHYFSDAKPAEKIGFRDTHIIKFPQEQKKIISTLMSSPKNGYHLRTPTKQTQPSTSCTPKRDRASMSRNNNEHSVSSPAKKFKPCTDWPDLDNESIESEGENLTLKYITTEGSVEFHKPSLKKLQSETKWKRPCKLSVAYTATNNQDFTVYLIIYEGNVKCRRNLLKEFDAEEQEN